VTAIAVVDHGAGNLVSIAQALETSGASVRIATGPGDLPGADAIVLPGVGATGAAMHRLDEAGLTEPLRAWDRPLLGICVGLQLFFTTSDEDGGRCLDLMPGHVGRLEDAPRLPHIGWNELRLLSADPLFAGIEPDATFYFVHSYAPVPDDPAIVIARSAHGRPFVAAVRRGGRVGVQFHPERSGRHGLAMLSNFVDSVKAGRDAA
jgi:glutamine amidotransferase